MSRRAAVGIRVTRTGFDPHPDGRRGCDEPRALGHVPRRCPSDASDHPVPAAVPSSGAHGARRPAPRDRLRLECRADRQRPAVGPGRAERRPPEPEHATRLRTQLRAVHRAERGAVSIRRSRGPRPGSPRRHRLGPAPRPIRAQGRVRLAAAQSPAPHRDAAPRGRRPGRRLRLHLGPGRADQPRARQRRDRRLGRGRGPRRHAVGDARGRAPRRARRAAGRRRAPVGLRRRRPPGGRRGQRVRVRPLSPGRRRPGRQGRRHLAGERRARARHGPRRRARRDRIPDGRRAPPAGLGRRRLGPRVAPGDPGVAQRHLGGLGGHEPRARAPDREPGLRAGRLADQAGRSWTASRRRSARASRSSTMPPTRRPPATPSTPGLPARPTTGSRSCSDPTTSRP